MKKLAEIIKITEMIFDEQSDAIIVNERYGFIQQLLALATVKEEEYRLSLSDKIDRVLTHRLLALPIFALFMWESTSYPSNRSVRWAPTGSMMSCLAA